MAVLTAAGISGCGFPAAYVPPGEAGDGSCRGVEIFLSRDSIMEGDTITARLLIIHEEGDKSFCEEGLARWESGETAVADVDGAGVVRGISPGETVLRARWNGFEADRALTVTRAVDYGNIVLSEIFYDDTGSDTGKEFIELRNHNDYSCDLSGFRLVDGASSSSPFVFPAGSAIPASGVIVVAQSAEDFKNRFGLDSHFAPFSFTLNNSGEVLFLLFPDGTLRDAVYIEGGSADFPAPPEWGAAGLPLAVEGNSLHRPLQADTDTYGDWEEGPPKPGY